MGKKDPNKLRKKSVLEPKKCKILVIEDNHTDYKIIKSSLQSKFKNYKNKYLFSIDEINIAIDALNKIKSDGDIQVILLDWLLLEPGHHLLPQPFRKMQDPSQNELIEEIRNLRPEIQIYVISKEENSTEIVNQCPNDNIKTFFSKQDIIDSPSEVLDRILDHFKERIITPFWTAYKDYVRTAGDSWHTPGHSGGDSFQNSKYLFPFYDYFGENYFRSDLSVSVEKLGSLLDSSKYIGKAQLKAARTFGVNKTFFATNGSSTSNKIIIQTILKPNDKVIVDRNCHKSVHYGIISSGAIPIYLKSEYSNKYSIFAPPSIDEIKKCIINNPDAKLLILTGCTYDGLLLDLKNIVELAHNSKMKVFVDEAWFAYASFHPLLRNYSAIVAKADYVTHSAHKVLSAFSQASLIHVNDPDFDEEFFRENFYIYTSTSPQYTMIASLDMACMQMEVEGFRVVQNAINLANKFRVDLKKLQNIKLIGKNEFQVEFPWLENDKVGYDPLKVTIDISNLNDSVDDVLHFLREEGKLEIEKSTRNTILILFTIGSTKSKIARLFSTLKKLSESSNKSIKGKKIYQIKNIPVPTIKNSPRDSFLGKRQLLPFEKTKNKIAAFMVVPYPPGIPLLVSGQKITQEHIDLLKEMIDEKIEIHGLYDNCIYVVAN